MKKCVLLAFAVLLLSCMAFTSEAAIYPDAILFSIDGSNVLRFNSTYTADISAVDTDFYDETGSGITTLDALKAVMGTADTPPRQFQVLSEDIDPHKFGQRTLGRKAVTATLEIGQKNQVRIVTITGIRERPLMGVSWSSTTVSNTSVAEGWERLGAYAVYLPRVSTEQQAQTILAQLNGFAATGGEDWHTGLFGYAKGEKGEGVTPHGTGSWNVTRDWSDYHMIRQSISMDVPFMGYCRGKQGFNIAMGGGLVQDVPYWNLREIKEGRTSESRVIPIPNSSNSGTESGYLAATTTHRHYTYEQVVSLDANGKPIINADGNITLLPYSGTGAAQYTTVSCDANCSPRVYVDGLRHSGGLGYHPLGYGPNGEKHSGREFAGILPNSKWVYNIVGSKTMQWIRTAHHQFANPNRLGDGITVVAYASDGVVESIEHQASLFAVGVQWHPEANVLTGPTNPTNFDQDLSVAFLREHVKYAGIHKDREALFSIFKNGKLPEDFKFEFQDFTVDNGNYLEYLELFKDKATVLDSSILDGWSVTGVSPQDAGSWLANVVGGSVVVTLNECVTDETVIVKLTKGGQTKEVAITFSGEKTVDPDDPDDSSSSSGCNAAQGYLVLAFFMGAVPYIFSKRK